MTAAMIIKIVIMGLVIIVLAIILSLLEIYTQLSRYKNYWDKNNLQTAQSGEIVYVAFGDSAAQGVGATKPQNGYVGLIAKDLEAKKDKPVRIINLSKSGAKVKDAIDTQLPAYKKLNLKSKPIITIEIGANDMIDFDEKRFESEMHRLLKDLPEGTIISDIPSFQGGRLSRLEPNVLKANEIIREHAGHHKHQLAELHKRVEANHSLKTVAADWFHPSSYAYRENWAPAFLEQID